MNWIREEEKKEPKEVEPNLGTPRNGTHVTPTPRGIQEKVKREEEREGGRRSCYARHSR
ncbi:hypothetical protein JMJ77_0007728 [Colletotrichum scovillei]|uniref:Uncharacterized protein n=1 Tax=Colletotrichum scovillei TaxID=1209932 RepID=A0A9P7RGP7_9PEZI|nr:hypothetical protein JMJ77_0007728 [Colletotrichum scovillei]KAG7074742.1 hypothetical protein JMJ76_0011214 [Colletotrichum scovillei]KAG7081919.1 hypothetical protein JMJ78_0004030 [Colletotrichum scovillei]